MSRSAGTPALVRWLHEYSTRQVSGHNVIGTVNDLANPQINSRTAQDVRLLARHAILAITVAVEATDN